MFLPVTDEGGTGLVLQLDPLHGKLCLWHHARLRWELALGSLVTAVESAPHFQDAGVGCRFCLLTRESKPVVLFADTRRHASLVCALVRALCPGGGSLPLEHAFHLGHLSMEKGVFWSKVWVALVSGRIYISQAQDQPVPTHVYWLESMRLVQPALESSTLELHGARPRESGARAHAARPVHRFSAADMVRAGAALVVSSHAVLT